MLAWHCKKDHYWRKYTIAMRKWCKVNWKKYILATKKYEENATQNIHI